MSTHIWEVAAAYARLFDVVKLRPWSNVAFETGWPSKHYSSSDAEAAWASWPAMNIGAIAWPDYWVLDLDGPEATTYFENLCRAHGEIREVTELTVTVRTPGRGGGLHLWWRVPELEPGLGLGQHLDGCLAAEIKHGPGRYTAVPPSARPEGRYEFVQAVREPQPTPHWLIPHATASSHPRSDWSSLVGMAELAEGDDVWAQCARTLITGTVTRGIEDVLAAPEGCRNRTLYASAHRFCEVGVADRLDELVAAAARNGLSRDEAERAVTSAASWYGGQR